MMVLYVYYLSANIYLTQHKETVWSVAHAALEVIHKLPVVQVRQIFLHQ